MVTDGLIPEMFMERQRARRAAFSSRPSMAELRSITVSSVILYILCLLLFPSLDSYNDSIRVAGFVLANPEIKKAQGLYLQTLK
jgi:hypothetical protein